MTTTIPGIEAYPKTIMLRDGSQIVLRPLAAEDKIRLLDFFRRIPEEERYYLKEDVTSPEVIQSWATSIDSSRIIPIVALAGDEIVADATLHRSRAMARCHVGEVRIVVDPEHREVGLGRRLLRELLDIASELGLERVTFELVTKHEEQANATAYGVGFQEVSVLKDRVRDFWGDYQDLVIMELPLRDYQLSRRF